MRCWRVVALLATPPVAVMLLGLAGIAGAILWVLRDAD
jgi:hypothetical protein